MKQAARKKRVSRAETIRRELTKIEREGPLTPERIVKAAKPKRHPLHDMFEWDDRKCGQEYRLWQARKLVARYMVEVKEGEELRTHLSVVDGDEGRRYVPVERVVSELELREQALQYISGMILHWRRQYSYLEDMFDELEWVVRRHRRKKRRKK